MQVEDAPRPQISRTGPRLGPYAGGHSSLAVINTISITNATAKWNVLRKSPLSLKNWVLGGLNSSVYPQDLEGLWWVVFVYGLIIFCCSPSCSFLHYCSRLGFQCFRGTAKWSVIVHHHSVPGCIDSAIQLVLIPKTQEKGMASPLRSGVQSLRLLLCVSPLLSADQLSAPVWVEAVLSAWAPGWRRPWVQPLLTAVLMGV